MSLTFERLYPWMFGLAAMLAAWMLGITFPDDSRKELLSAAISISSIFAGFLATAKAILMAMPSTGLMRELKDNTGYIGDLAGYLRDGLIASLSFAIISLLGFFPLGHGAWFVAIWIGLAVISVAAFWRVSNIMTYLLKR